MKGGFIFFLGKPKTYSKVMCIMDGADFEPYWMTNRCDLILDERESAEFWVQLSHIGFISIPSPECS